MKKKKWNFQLNHNERMQLKALICVLGVLLLTILMVVRILTAISNGFEREEEIPVAPPVIEYLKNVWIMDATADKLSLFRDGSEDVRAWAENVQINNTPVNDLQTMETGAIREQIADVVITDGVVTEVIIKTDKIHGRLLRADTSGIELEGYGKVPLSEDYKGYRIYKELTMCFVGNLPFGYDYADYVIENGEICGILWAKEEPMEKIRVLLKTSDYGKLIHKEVVLSSDCDFTVQYGQFDNLITEKITAGTVLTINTDSNLFSGERVMIIPDVLTGKMQLQSCSRSSGVPEYRGTLELVKTQEGIVVINELPLEEYLYSVVPSEMPANYQEEALKAQAICARTYAYGKMVQAAYPQYGAHVDDSTSYQVYNNIQEQESTTTAVKNTYGKLLFTPQGEMAETFYYSTSCGAGTDANVWKTEEESTLTYLKGKVHRYDGEETAHALGEALREEDNFRAFITTKNPQDFEIEEGWYRWSAEVEDLDLQELEKRMQTRYAVNPGLVLTREKEEFVSKPIQELSAITNIAIEKRGIGGVGEELVITTTKTDYKVISEYNIRYVLNLGDGTVTRQDGKEVVSANLLPSAFAVLELYRENGKKSKSVTGYRVIGGGFGHGVGMSQNGANHLAVNGWKAEEILGFYYEDCTVRSVYE